MMLKSNPNGRQYLYIYDIIRKMARLIFPLSLASNLHQAVVQFDVQGFQDKIPDFITPFAV